jgi:protein phosphatase
MLVCPHCHFQNPDSNRFCQKCGGALAEPPLPADPSPSLEDLDLEDLSQGSVTRYAIFAAVQSPAIAAGSFLDEQQRYQLITDLPSLTSTEFAAIVKDTQPLQPPILDEFYRQQIGYPSAPAPGQTLTVPAAAQPYLELRKRHPFLPLPKIHDAWEQKGLSVVLLENRSHLPSLLSVWGGQAVLAEIMDWLDEMIELWAALQPQNACRSLTKLENLRVDDDGLLCLQRLYFDDTSAQLQDLGQVWQTLFSESQRTQRGDLSQLFQDMQAGNVVSLDELRSRLKPIKESLGEVSAPLPPPPVFTNLPTWDEDSDDSMEMTRSSADYSTVALPMQLSGFEDAGITDIGNQRNHNEDCFSLQSTVKKVESPHGRSLQAQGLYILCDGMGGHEGGEVASALAVETLENYFAEHWRDRLPTEEQILEAIGLANRAIFDLNQERSSSGSGRMGTTLAMALVQNNTVAIAHVGDSRIYSFSERDGLKQLTIDHEVGQREMQRGVEEAIAYARPDAYQLTQALGPRDANGIKPEVKFVDLNEDTLLLLCSDGLTDNDLLETFWESHLTPLLSGQMTLDIGVSHLIELANQHNGHDNITVVAVRSRFLPNLVQPMVDTALV